ncbi:MAG: DUF5103 domain-containing protein [Paludibacteraceae bacterium]|nr:DUF5103 domain-containing protein [Paludibacteraceae bacterium]
MHKTIVLLFISILSFPMIAAPHSTHPVMHNIRTLRVRYAREAMENKHSDPVRPYLTLTGSEIDGTDPDNTLEISFDEMSHDIHQYAYTVTHLNAQYEPDDLSSFEYVNGFTRCDITDYATSINTAVNYTHYTFSFPNEDMRLSISGNYLLTIYDASIGEEAVAAEVVFEVTESVATVLATVTPHTTREISGRYQQINVDVNTTGLNMVSPDELTLLVRQNGRLDNQVFNPHPTYIETNHLKWIDHSALVFEGGNEYRHMDIWSTYFAGYNVDRIRYDGTDYHAFLMADPIRGTLNPDAGRCGTNYMHEYDHNGMMVINAERCNDIDTEAEYMYVHFTLPSTTPIFDGSIYIGGDIFYNQMAPRLNRMLYDNDYQCYYMNALLKQGGYDYIYLLKKKSEPSGSLLMTEGSHWQTENTYTVYVYFHGTNDRYDRLVAVYYSSSI